MTETPHQVAYNPELFAAVFLRILDKEKNLIPLRWNKAQRHFHQNRTGRDIILKARQIGFSTYIQAEMFRRAVTSTRATITMAHDDETTQLIRRMSNRFWEHCRFNDIQPARKYANASLATYPDFDSEMMISTAGSKERGRGGSYTDFHGSEVGFWTDAEKLIAGAMQGGNPDVILESTPNGAQGWFYDKCMEALDGGSIWTLHFYPWWWDDTYRIPLEPDEVIEYTDEERALVAAHHLDAEQIKWRRRKKQELGWLFVQEYPEDPMTCFLTSGNGYFSDLSIPLMDVFTAPTGATYQDGHRYLAGLDFAQDPDYLSLTVNDYTDMAQVDLLHINKLPWAELRSRVKEKYDEWHLPFILAEANSMGKTNIEAMQDMGMKVIPFDTTNDSKWSGMQGLHESLDHGFKMLPIEVQKHEFQTFVASQLPSGVWRLAAEGSGHDDTVISAMLAHEALKYNYSMVAFVA